MKKTILLMLLIIFAFAKTTPGQVTVTITDISYEHHFQKYHDADFGYSELQSIHSGRFGFLGGAFLLGREKNYGLEWMPFCFMASSNKKYNVCFLNFTFRREMGRFCPALYMNIFDFDLDVYRNTITNKISTIIHHSLAAGFEYYLTNYSIITVKAGANYEMPGVLNNNTSKLSPFFGIGYKLELDWEWDKY